MANFSATQAINQASPLIKSRVDQSHGRIRFFESLYAAPASGAAPAIADKIIWGTLPIGAVLLTHLAQMAWNTGTASCTLNLGDSCVAAKHLAATAITTTGTATPSVATLIKTCVADVESGSFILSNIKGMGALTVGDLVTGIGIPAASYISGINLANRTATFTNLAGTSASATNAAVPVTSTGHPYRCSDNSANAANGYVSTTDDCTLIGTVAGAQIANNQQIRLIMPYVMD